MVNDGDVQYRALYRNGRYYHAWRAGKYPFPCDRIARDNEDIMMAAIYHFCYGTGGFDDSRLEDVLIAPLIRGNSRLRRMVDLACGSGSWVANVACSFPNAIVVGVDLIEGQPTLVHARDLASTGMCVWLTLKRQESSERNLAGAKFLAWKCPGHR